MHVDCVGYVNDEKTESGGAAVRFGSLVLLQSRGAAIFSCNMPKTLIMKE